MLFDMHNDYLTASEAERKKLDFCGMPMTVIFAVWASRLALDAGAYFDIVSRVPQGCRLTSLTAIEDIGAIDIGDYDEFLSSAQPAYVSLTWNGESGLAGGVGSAGRLTAKGKAVLRAMERGGITLDLSHLNEDSFWDALDYFDGKVILSHTAVRRCNPCARNSSEKQIHAVSGRKGIIGIFTAANFLCAGRCLRGDYVRHILTAVEQAGIDAVALGTDFCGAERYPEGFSGYSDADALRDDLFGLGLTNSDIDKIFYMNAEKYFGSREL